MLRPSTGQFQRDGYTSRKKTCPGRGRRGMHTHTHTPQLRAQDGARGRSERAEHAASDQTKGGV